MRYVAIEYHAPKTNQNYKGFLSIPEEFPGNWSNGFVDYIRDKNNMTSCDDVDIYPLNLPTNHYSMGITPNGYKNMYDDFVLALRSNKYYPSNKQNDAIRRMWSKHTPQTQTFAPRGFE